MHSKREGRGLRPVSRILAPHTEQMYRKRGLGVLFAVIWGLSLRPERRWHRRSSRVETGRSSSIPQSFPRRYRKARGARGVVGDDRSTSSKSLRSCPRRRTVLAHQMSKKSLISLKSSPRNARIGLTSQARTPNAYMSLSMVAPVSVNPKR